MIILRQAKILSSYRLPEQTRVQIKHIAEKYQESESEIVKIATSELYNRLFPEKKIKNDLSKSELIRRAKNLDEGRGKFLTDAEFEQQSEDK